MRQDEANATHGPHRSFLGPAQLVAEGREVYVQCASVVEEPLAPYAFDDVVPSAHDTLVPEQIQQQAEFRVGEYYRLARLQRLMRGGIDQDVGVMDDFLHRQL